MDARHTNAEALCGLRYTHARHNTTIEGSIGMCNRAADPDESDRVPPSIKQDPTADAPSGTSRPRGSSRPSRGAGTERAPSGHDAATELRTNSVLPGRSG